MQSRSDAYGVGETVVSVVDGERGTVVSLERAGGVFFVEWRDGEFPVAYPLGTDQIRRVYPWEM